MIQTYLALPDWLSLHDNGENVRFVWKDKKRWVEVSKIILSDPVETWLPTVVASLRNMSLSEKGC